MYCAVIITMLSFFLTNTARVPMGFEGLVELNFVICKSDIYLLVSMAIRLLLIAWVIPLISATSFITG